MSSASTSTLTVGGMHCGHCASSVTKGIQTVTGVVDVAVDVPTGQVTVTTDREVPTSELEQAVTDAGFEVTSDLHAR